MEVGTELLVQIYTFVMPIWICECRSFGYVELVQELWYGELEEGEDGV